MQANDNPGSPDSMSDDDPGGELPEFPPSPKELEYLVEAAIQYGRKYRFDDAIQWFLENAEQLDVETLAGLAERARLSGDYSRLWEWSQEVDDVVDRVVDERYPYTIDISEQQRNDFLRLINPKVAGRWREKALRHLAEANDRSDIAERRKKMRGRLLAEANEIVQHMDIYFLFALMDACDMEFE